MDTVCHLTTVHPRNDIRIYYKECCSLHKAGFNVSIIVADGKDDDVNGAIKINDIGKPSGRLIRFLVYSWKCYRKARELDSDLFHFHDPELLFVGLALKLRGHKVIFDSHEMTGRQIREKQFLPSSIRNLTSKIYLFLENSIVKALDAVVVPQKYIMVDQFSRLGTRTEVISNFASLKEHDVVIEKAGLKSKSRINLLYSGSISNSRGLINMLNLVQALDDRYKLIIAGSFSLRQDYDTAQKHPGWKKVDFRGFLQREDLSSLYEEADIGLIMFNPIGQYSDATSPLKLFEYLLYGLPTITPDYGSWPSFKEKHEVTFTANVEDTNTQVKIINDLNKDDLLYKRISKKARTVVEQEYNWENESKKLIQLYNDILQ